MLHGLAGGSAQIAPNVRLSIGHDKLYPFIGVYEFAHVPLHMDVFNVRICIVFLWLRQINVFTSHICAEH